MTLADYGASNGAFADREQRDGSVLPPAAGNLRELCPGGQLRLGKAALPDVLAFGAHNDVISRIDKSVATQWDIV